MIPTINNQIFARLANRNPLKAFLVAQGGDEVLESFVLEFGVADGMLGACWWHAKLCEWLNAIR